MRSTDSQTMTGTFFPVIPSPATTVDTIQESPRA